MYEYVRGKVVDKHPTAVIVECGGIGYRLRVPVSTYEKLSSGQEVTVLTHLCLSADEFRLYGFATQAEREVFRALLTVGGIGPGIALGILSGTSVGEFSRAIEGGDEDFLRRIKGVGKKTAQRLIVELRGKLPPFEAKPREVSRYEQARRDACAALVSLGFRQGQAEEAVGKAAKVLGESARVEELVREALRQA